MPDKPRSWYALRSKQKQQAEEKRRGKERARRRKLGVIETVPVIGTEGNVYEVEVLENGKARCPCKGFRYRHECRHLLDPEVRDAVSEHGPARHSYAEVAMLAAAVCSAILPYCAKVKVQGSLRRQKPDVKDIDIIFIPGAWSAQRVVQLFRSFGTPVHHGESMGAIVLPNGVPAQLWPVEGEEVWGAAQLHYTGPRNYNISLRIRANRRGWKLSQHGLVDRQTERMIAGRSEEEVLQALELPWLPPSLREQHQQTKVLQAGRRGRYRTPGKGF
ncbi:MAG: hypothetical protein AB7N76_20320 [Planctomycetota bacterium]